MKTHFFYFLKLPYTYQSDIKSKLLRCLFYAVFIFLFLLVFRPFGLAFADLDIVKASAGYALTTLGIMILLNVIFPLIFRTYFKEDVWTIGRELFWTMVNLTLIGLANAYYSSFSGIGYLSTMQLLKFGLFTFAVGIIPITMVILYKHSKLDKKFNHASEQMNAKLNSITWKNAVNQEIIKNDEEYAVFTSINPGETVKVKLSELMYVKSSDNYVEVHTLSDQIEKKQLIRNTMKTVVSDNSAGHKLVRCHNSYAVNIKNVIHVTGNAQGYKLHLRGIDTQIPVSRQYGSEIKQLISSI